MDHSDDRSTGATGTTTPTGAPTPAGDVEPLRTVSPGHPSLGWMAGIVAAMLFASAGIGLSVDLLRGNRASASEWSYATDGELAFHRCTSWITDELLEPDSADFPEWDSEAVSAQVIARHGDRSSVRIDAHLDAANELGSALREPWSCEFDVSQHGLWLDEIDVGGTSASELTR